MRKYRKLVMYTSCDRVVLRMPGPPDVRIQTVAKSRRWTTVLSSRSAAVTGRSRGRVIRTKVRSGPAPSI